MCWPHRVGVSVCHLAFIVVLFFKTKNRKKIEHPLKAPNQYQESLETLKASKVLFSKDMALNSDTFVYLNHLTKYIGVQGKSGEN